MPRNTMKSALGAALFVPGLLLTACGPEAGPGISRPPVNPETALVASHAPSHKGYLWNAVSGKLETVHYAEVDGLAVVEGDMVVGTVEEMEARTQAVEARSGLEAGHVQALGAAVTVFGLFNVRWPNGVVPYTIDPALPNPQRVATAINAWQTATRIRFVLRTTSNASQYPNFITFTPHDSACSSGIGKATGQRAVNLALGCDAPRVVHEIGHSLGLWHEQSRADRDSFVRILWENIIPEQTHNFETAYYSQDVLTYDYGSIMHYGAYDFSKNGLPTIEALGGQAIGQRIALSATDAATIERVYSIDDSEYFVEQLYADVLNRESDSSGYKFFLDGLQSCSGNQACLDSARVSTARSLFESAEHRQQHPELDPSSPNYKSAYIQNCYTSFLRRPQGPGDGTFWLDVLNSTGDYNAVIRGFINSSEYRSRFSR